MPLTAAVARFRTNDDDQNRGTVLSIYVDGPMGRVAQAEGIAEILDHDSENTPLALTVVRPVQRWEVGSCRTRVHIDPVYHRTRSFDYELNLSFDDAPGYVKTWNALVLRQDDSDFSDALG